MIRSRTWLSYVVIAAVVFAFGKNLWSAEPVPGPDKFAMWLEGPDGEKTVEAGQTEEKVVSVLLRVDQGEVQGWSFGVCHEDSTVVTVTDVTIEGTDTEKVNGGNKPDFESTTVYPGGVTQGVVIHFMQQNFLAPTERFEMLRITYRFDGAPGSETTADFCNTLGEPPVETVVVVGGQSINPATLEGVTLRVKEGPGIKAVFATSPLTQTLPANKTTTAKVKVELGLAEDSAAAAVQGWSYGLAHDGNLLELVSIEPSDLTNTANGGNPPDFYGVNINPAGGSGGTVGCVISLGPEFHEIPLQPGEKIHTETFTYRSAVELAQGDSEQTTEVSLANEVLGDPPVPAVISVLSDSYLLTEVQKASITLTPPLGRLRPFVRGDANNDARVDIADGVWILSWIYRGGVEPPCQDAADANDDGTVDQSDAIVVVYWRLKGGSPPAEPFPECGTDPNDRDSDNPEDGLSCKAIGAGCE